MFSITFENEVYKQWTFDYLFETYEGARRYLVTNGFIERNRVFERKDYNWRKYDKAYIKEMKLWNKGGK